MKSFRTLGFAILTLALAVPAFAGVPPAPEIDPSLAQSGITVLVGGVLILLGQRRK
ncbi:MAG: hypothetical protein ACHQ9S_17350 [Candidatus Binatia bacterium]